MGEAKLTEASFVQMTFNEGAVTRLVAGSRDPRDMGMAFTWSLAPGGPDFWSEQKRNLVAGRQLCTAADLMLKQFLEIFRAYKHGEPAPARATGEDAAMTIRDTHGLKQDPPAPKARAQTPDHSPLFAAMRNTHHGDCDYAGRVDGRRVAGYIDED